MQYEESYYGQRIIVTTEETAEGTWTSRAELSDVRDGALREADVEGEYMSEDEARRAAVSAAAAAVDRTRAMRGKP
jgi:hypothetical protein